MNCSELVQSPLDVLLLRGLVVARHRCDWSCVWDGRLVIAREVSRLVVRDWLVFPSRALAGGH